MLAGANVHPGVQDGVWRKGDGRKVRLDAKFHEFRYRGLATVVAERDDAVGVFTLTMIVEFAHPDTDEPHQVLVGPADVAEID